ncbi:hypothetical protein [Paracoccus pantotrophus]|uniref:hypothetical protein n=1 Tax=Paracoccus pantotrophus TaxID=82367 RepID=UPI0035B2CFB9
MSDDATNDANSKGQWSCERGPKGQFITTSGRPLGSKGRTKRSITTALHNRTETALAALDALIAAGSEKAVLFVLERNLPKGGRALEMHGTSPEDIEAAIMDGSISPDEARTLAQTLASLKSLRDMDDLAQRLQALEKLIGED